MSKILVMKLKNFGFAAFILSLCILSWSCRKKVPEEPSVVKLIADYPLITNSLDQTGHFGAIAYGSHATQPPPAVCVNGEPAFEEPAYGTFTTPDLHSLFNIANFKIDLDFVSKGSKGAMPVYMVGPFYRTIGVYISQEGKLGIKYNNNNYLYSEVNITTGRSYHVSLRYASPDFQLYLDNVSVLSGGLPSLIFDPNPSDIKLVPADLSNASVFNGCMNNLKIFNTAP